MLVDFPTILFFIALFGLCVWAYDYYFNQASRDKANNEIFSQLREITRSEMIRIAEKEVKEAKEAKKALKAKESKVLNNKKIETEEMDKTHFIHAPDGRVLIVDKKNYEKLSFEPLVLEYSKAFFPIIVLVIILRSFIAEPFKIPSDSMVPTLLDGDFILVNKSAYGIHLPLINKKIINVDKPKRGEVVVFRYPPVPSTNFIKRVIGLPGDTIRYQNHKLTITTADNKKVDIQYKELTRYKDDGKGNDYFNYIRHHEYFGSKKHPVIQDYQYDRSRGFTCLDANNEFTVPKGHYFVMGDNRDWSSDSRVWCSFPKENLVGRAVAVWFNVDPLYFKNSFELINIFGFRIKPAFWQYMRGSRMFKGIN